MHGGHRGTEHTYDVRAIAAPGEPSVGTLRRGSVRDPTLSLETITTRVRGYGHKRAAENAFHKLRRKLTSFAHSSDVMFLQTRPVPSPVPKPRCEARTKGEEKDTSRSTRTRTKWYAYSFSRNSMVPTSARNVASISGAGKGGAGETLQSKTDGYGCDNMPVIRQFSGTCWFNAILTCFVQSKRMIELLETKRKTWRKGGKASAPLYKSIKNMMEWTPRRPYAPKFFHPDDFLIKLNNLFGVGDLPDCHQGGNVRDTLHACELLFRLLNVQGDTIRKFTLEDFPEEGDAPEGEVVVIKSSAMLDRDQLYDVIEGENFPEDSRDSQIMKIEISIRHLSHKLAMEEDPDPEVLDIRGKRFFKDAAIFGNSDHAVAGVTCRENGKRYLVNTATERWIEFDWLRSPYFVWDDEDDGITPTFPVDVLEGRHPDVPLESMYFMRVYVCVSMASLTTTVPSISNDDGRQNRSDNSDSQVQDGMVDLFCPSRFSDVCPNCAPHCRRMMQSSETLHLSSIRWPSRFYSSKFGYLHALVRNFDQFANAQQHDVWYDTVVNVLRFRTDVENKLRRSRISQSNSDGDFQRLAKLRKSVQEIQTIVSEHRIKDAKDQSAVRNLATNLKSYMDRPSGFDHNRTRQQNSGSNDSR